MGLRRRYRPVTARIEARQLAVSANTERGSSAPDDVLARVHDLGDAQVDAEAREHVRVLARQPVGVAEVRPIIARSASRAAT